MGGGALPTRRVTARGSAVWIVSGAFSSTRATAGGPGPGAPRRWGFRATFWFKTPQKERRLTARLCVNKMALLERGRGQAGGRRFYLSSRGPDGELNHLGANKNIPLLGQEPLYFTEFLTRLTLDKVL